jgi:protein-disulfide isomerase
MVLRISPQKLGSMFLRWKKCIKEGKYLNAVNADMEQGKSLGVKSTPTFFVNGQLVQGAQPIEVFSEIIDQAL